MSECAIYWSVLFHAFGMCFVYELRRNNEEKNVTEIGVAGIVFNPLRKPTITTIHFEKSSRTRRQIEIYWVDFVEYIFTLKWLSALFFHIRSFQIWIFYEQWTRCILIFPEGNYSENFELNFESIWWDHNLIRCMFNVHHNDIPSHLSQVDPISEQKFGY